MNTLSRRRFIQTLAAVGITAPVATYSLMQFAKHPASSNEIWFSAQGSESNQYGLGLLQGDQVSTAASTFRGHGLAQNPSNLSQVVMFARRPGTLGLVYDIERAQVVHQFHSPANHHMNGHGCFSQDGQYLYCAESDYKNGQGVITVRQTSDYALVSQFASHGIGPHEIGLMPGGKTLAIANGGLLTHPDTGREVLNADAMRSTLSYVNVQNGELVNELTLTEPKSSIRHLDIAADGTVALAIQAQRFAMNHQKLVSLAAVHKVADSQLTELTATDPLIEKLEDYMGSVRICAKSRIAAFTSPRGNMAMFWNLTTNQLAGYHVFHDVCGLTLTADQSHFVLSNSSGKIRLVSTTTLQESEHLRQAHSTTNWDNHMITVQRA